MRCSRAGRHAQRARYVAGRLGALPSGRIVAEAFSKSWTSKIVVTKLCDGGEAAERVEAAPLPRRRGGASYLRTGELHARQPPAQALRVRCTGLGACST